MLAHRARELQQSHSSVTKSTTGFTTVTLPMALGCGVDFLPGIPGQGLESIL
jgi:hypothetical protein